MIVAGVDIGNQTTEVALARLDTKHQPCFLAQALVPTTGIKGTNATSAGVRDALELAARDAGIDLAEITLVRINEAAPVVAGVAMQTITETTLTDSTLVGHNPETPGGLGLGFGQTRRIEDLAAASGPVIAVVPSSVPFERGAALINAAASSGTEVTGAIVEQDDGVLIANRLKRPIPIVDEVRLIARVPLGQPAAIEVAPAGATIQTLCNPYGLATLFALDAETTARLAPAARALTGLRSAVVIRMPVEAMSERRIEAGAVRFVGERGERRVDVREGATALMLAAGSVGRMRDVSGGPGTAAGAMFGELRSTLAAATSRSANDIRVQDLLAVDLAVPQPVAGGLSNEVAPERAVAMAAMVQAGGGLSTDLAAHLQAQLGIDVVPGGVEARAGIAGALTTPGTARPLCVIDLGSGSTNAARIDERSEITHVHLAGGGAMVNLLIGEELAIEDPELRESLKRHRVARADSLFTLRHEDGTVQFLDDPLMPHLYARTVLLGGEVLAPVPGNPPVERVVAVRRRAKKAVLGTNAERALRALAPGGNPRLLGIVVLIGGSALDFELPGILAAQLAEYGIVTGTANVRGRLGPRNAVATGLVLQSGAISP